MSSARETRSIGDGTATLAEQARAASLTRDGVSSLAEQLNPERDEVHAAVATLAAAADARSAACLALAAALAGAPCDAALIGRFLPLVVDGNAVVALVASCGGDRVAMLVDMAHGGRLDPFQAATATWFAAQLSARDEPPPELITELRRLARRASSLEAMALVGLAAQTLDDPHLTELADRHIALVDALPNNKFVAHYRTALDQPVLDLLPDEEKREPRSRFTVRRAAKKVGRNEPCPCGSGKKYKRCCIDSDQTRLADPSPVAGVTMAEYRAKAHEYMSPSQFATLHPDEMLALGIDALPTSHLLRAFDKWCYTSYWAEAERAIDVLGTRTDRPPGLDSVDELRVELVHQALGEGATEVAARQGALIEDQDAMGVLSARLELIEPTAQTLANLEQWAQDALAEPDGDTPIDLAYALLDQFPALGIYVTRGIVSSERSFDADLLLDTVERARDELQLPPGDDAAMIYELRLGERVARHAPSHSDETTADDATAALHDEANALRAQLTTAARRSDDLERALASARDALSAQTAASPTAAASSDERELRRLRDKVAELKGLVRDSNDDRRAMRTELTTMAERLDTSQRATAADAAPTPAPAPVPRDAAPRFARALVPAVAPAAQRDLASMPANVAARAIRLMSDIAIGDASPAAHVKRLGRAADVWSARVGIHHRLLFRFDGTGRRLDVCRCVARADLDTAVKSLS